MSNSLSAAELERNRVYQSNNLVEASYTLTTQEKRLVTLAASLIDSKREGPEEGVVSVTAEAFANVFGLEVRHSYGILAEAVERLWNRELKPKNGEAMRWIYYKQYIEGEGRVEVGFSPKVLPHLTMLNREFTGYKLKYISNLASFYAFRIYELMVQYKKFRERSLDLPRLRELLQMENKYPNVKDLRVYVLDPAVSEINMHTDLSLSLEPYRKGRRIAGFRFTIKESEQIPLAL